MRKTKIIATLGPASFNFDILSELVRSGMDVARINMSHYDPNINLNKYIEHIRFEAKKLNRSVSIMFDICGPKIRVDNLENSTIKIHEGENYSLGSKNSDIPLNIDISFTKNESKGVVKIDDGSISFDVIDVDKSKLIISANNSGEILSGKGVNFPGVKLDLPSITLKDKADIKLAIDLDADWIAMSFVRSPKDYKIIKTELSKNSGDIPVIAKIEKPEAIENLDSIINSFDGILVARGDLGVEMPIYKLPILQKKIVNQSLQKRKPVIIATQILDSMIHNPNPTRAEVNDIANAIYDGADAMMLSGETTVGDYPVESVKMMSDVANSIDKDLDLRNFNRYIQQRKRSIIDTRSSICHAAMILSNDLEINNIVIMTETGLTAMKMARYRPKANIFALCTINKIFYQLSMIWGITPILVNPYSTTDQMIQDTGTLLKEYGNFSSGDLFIITAGVAAGKSGSTNMLKIHEID